MFVKVIDGADYRHVYGVGDLHGEITKLNEALEEVKFDKEQDLLLSVGDLIDRGEDSLACLSLIDEPWFESVMGNHEKMAFEALTSKSNEIIMHWFKNGGSWYVDTDTVRAGALILKAGQLPLIIEFNDADRKILICHADYPLNTYSREEFKGAEMHLLWSRERIQRILNGDEPTEIKGVHLALFGHTKLSKPLQSSNQVYIDTGACYGNELTLVKIK